MQKHLNVPLFHQEQHTIPHIYPQKVSSFWSTSMTPQTRASANFVYFLFFFLLWQNYWIDRNSAVLCFKQGMNFCPICAASLNHSYFVYGKFGVVPITANTYHLKKGYQKKRKRIHDRTNFWSRPVTRNRRLFCVGNRAQFCSGRLGVLIKNVPFGRFHWYPTSHVGHSDPLNFQ